ncbi:MAG: hypothetical protein R3350_09070 [Saprospiraceae bacterium]|nr:hypothetical protein [Saprospiraceae bacterium]
MSSTQHSDSFYARAYNPYLQASITFGCVLLVIFLSKIVKFTGMVYVPTRFPWMTAAVFLLCFALFNSVFSLSADNMKRYWGRSLYSFLGLGALSALSAYLFSSLTIDQAGSYRWIFIVVTFAYLVFLTMMGLMRKIVEFAQREEWNHPRIRKNPGNDKKTRQ